VKQENHVNNLCLTPFSIMSTVLSFPQEAVINKCIRDWKHWTAHRYSIRWQRDFLSIGCETMSISRRKWTMCFKIRFALDWQPIGGIGHLLYSRKGDAKGGGAAAPRIILVGTPRRRGPKFQARRRRCWMQRRLAPRKSDGDGAPSLEETNALTRGG
jgi:hypothetical protein